MGKVDFYSAIFVLHIHGKSCFPVQLNSNGKWVWEILISYSLKANELVSEIFPTAPICKQSVWLIYSTCQYVLCCWLPTHLTMYCCVASTPLEGTGASAGGVQPLAAASWGAGAIVCPAEALLTADFWPDAQPAEPDGGMRRQPLIHLTKGSPCWLRENMTRTISICWKVKYKLWSCGYYRPRPHTCLLWLGNVWL